MEDNKYVELKDFIGAIVIAPRTNKRFALREITSPEIGVVSETPGISGCPEHYVYRTINGDPFSTGALVFENPELTEPFKSAYKAYCRTEDAYWDSYGYWMHRD